MNWLSYVLEVVSSNSINTTHKTSVFEIALTNRNLHEIILRWEHHLSSGRIAGVTSSRLQQSKYTSRASYTKFNLGCRPKRTRINILGKAC